MVWLAIQFALHEDRFVAAQLLIIVKGILFILGLWFACNVLATHVLDDVANVVVLAFAQFAAATDHNFIAAAAKVLFVMDQEILASLRPELHFW